MAHARNGPVDGDELTKETLRGAKIYGEDGSLVAEVASLQGRGPYANVILQTEGFLGFGSKLVTLPMRSLTFVHGVADTTEARTTWNLEDLKKAPTEVKSEKSLRPVRLSESL